MTDDGERERRRRICLENEGLIGCCNVSQVLRVLPLETKFTHVGGRRVVQISSGFMIFFSILVFELNPPSGKFGVIFTLIPSLIVTALYCLIFTYVVYARAKVLAGLSLLQFCNLNGFRTKFVLGFSVFLGLSVHGYGPVHTGARWFNDMVNMPFSSKPFVAGFLRLVLDLTFRHEDSATRRDRGMHWGDRFRSFQADTRSEQFYYLPFNLSKFFPSV